MYQGFRDTRQAMSRQIPGIKRLTGISRCKLMRLSDFTDDKGSLIVAEENEHIPFKIKRIFYLYGIPKGALRGGHAHKRLHQFVIAAAGSFDVTVDDGLERKKFHLIRPDHGLYIPPMIWDELENFSPGSLCLVLASDRYDELDYIRDFNEFKKRGTLQKS